MMVMNSPREFPVDAAKHPGLSGGSFITAFQILELNHVFLNKFTIRNAAYSYRPA